MMKAKAILSLLPLAASAQLHYMAFEHPATTNFVREIAELVATNLTTEVTFAGGFASPTFWYPVATFAPFTEEVETLQWEDVFYTRSMGSFCPAFDLGLKAEDRSAFAEESVPESVEWSLTSTAAHLGEIAGNTFTPYSNAVGIAKIVATADGVSRSLSVPVQAKKAFVTEYPSASVAGMWREKVNAAAFEILNAAENSEESSYKNCVVEDYRYPNALQLYNEGGVNNDTMAEINPTETNKGFVSPQLANALRACSVRRGDWYGWKPYTVIAPHYVLSAKHWDPQYPFQSIWCTDRATDRFMTNNLDSAKGVGFVADFEVFRVKDAFPSDMILKFARPEDVKELSPSRLRRVMGFTLNQHNCVSPVVIFPAAWAPYYAKTFEELEFDEYLGASTNPQRAIGGETTLAHPLHKHDSGHLIFYWTGKVVIPAGIWTSAFVNYSLLNKGYLQELREIIRSDSGQQEDLTFFAKEDLL